MIFSCFIRRSFQNALQPWWTIYNDIYPVASNLLSLAWRLRLDPIMGYTHSHLCMPRACLPFQWCLIRAQEHCTVSIIHCQFLFRIRPLKFNENGPTVNTNFRIAFKWKDACYNKHPNRRVTNICMKRCMLQQPSE